MWMRAVGWATVFFFALPLWALPRLEDWVPARWPWTDEKSLELLTGTPINCLLVKSYSAELAARAGERGAVVLAVIAPGGDAVAEARRAAVAKLAGVVLDGDFPDGIAARVREAIPALAVVELTSREHMKLDREGVIIGTYQGVWPGIQILENGSQGGPTERSAWIDTNTGFIRAVRAWGGSAVWVGQPAAPAKPSFPMRATCRRSPTRPCRARAGWWPSMTISRRGSTSAMPMPSAVGVACRSCWAISKATRSGAPCGHTGKLAIVQDPAKGGLLSGGILDMIAVKHTPVRAVPRQHLTRRPWPEPPWRWTWMRTRSPPRRRMC